MDDCGGTEKAAEAASFTPVTALGRPGGYQPTGHPRRGGFWRL